MTLEDVQARPDDRNIPLNDVGIGDIRYPIAVVDQERGKQSTVGHFRLSVALGGHVKGTHMSRFVELLAEHAGEVSISTMTSMGEMLRGRLDAPSATLEVSYPFFLERVAPVSGARACLEYKCVLKTVASAHGVAGCLTVQVPVTSVCPCSKAISDYGAHNQRGYITISVVTDASCDEPLVFAEELITVAEGSASAPVLPLVKRPDERYLTMLAFENPVFVEDMVRNVVLRLRTDQRLATHYVEATNEESIHHHSAFAETASADFDVRMRPRCVC